MRFTTILKSLAVGALALTLASPVAAAPLQTLRVGLVKIGSILVLKQQGTLAKRLAEKGINLEWKEFDTGAALMAALGAGAVDFGPTGDTGPIFAQASGISFYYAAYMPSPGTNSAILVPPNSPIRTLADLRGKRVAVAKGSNTHNILIQAVEHAGMQFSDINAVYLGPADAGAAFSGGSVDAWAIWDPIYALAQVKFNARVVSNAVGIAPSSDFFLASRSFADEHPDVLKMVIEEITQASNWGKTHPDELAVIMAEATGVPLEAQKLTAPRGNFDVRYMDDGAVKLQQSIADRVFKLNLIAKAVVVGDAAWKPKP